MAHKTASWPCKTIETLVTIIPTLKRFLNEAALCVMTEPSLSDMLHVENPKIQPVII
ncbi:MAG TPA: hypothetical protein VFB55_05410 [Verrucomicrobiae bacterium]|nr:hypothetical protein [Verrucomicrobiae bacterium]